MTYICIQVYCTYFYSQKYILFLLYFIFCVFIVKILESYYNSFALIALLLQLKWFYCVYVNLSVMNFKTIIDQKELSLIEGFVCVHTCRVLSSLLSVWMWAEVQLSPASSWSPARWTLSAEEDSSRDWWTSGAASDSPRTAPETHKYTLLNHIKSALFS